MICYGNYSNSVDFSSVKNAMQDNDLWEMAISKNLEESKAAKDFHTVQYFYLEGEKRWVIIFSILLLSK